MHIRKIMKQTLATVLSISMLTSGNVSLAAKTTGDRIIAKNKMTAEEEARLKETIRDSDEMVAEYPNGQFNFLATQFETRENDEYVEIPIIRQGGTKGEAKVLFRTIDVTSQYGDDYEIYISKSGKKADMIKKGEDAAPLIESAYNDETDISEADTEDIVEDARDTVVNNAQPSDKAQVSDDARQSENVTDAINALPDAQTDEASTVQTADIADAGAEGLKSAISNTTGIASDRKDWRVVANESAEEKEVREQYDTFLTLAGGSEEVLTFEDGEYIKYIYLFPKDDDVAEAEEQLIMALIQADENAPVGKSYSAYVNIKDNEKAEKIEYKFAKDEVVTDKDKVSVTIKRTSGTGYHDTIYVGTGEGTANPGADYTAGVKAVNFYAGQTEQKVTVDILDNEYREEDRDFYLLITRNQETYEESGCHVIIKGNGKGTFKGQSSGSWAERITSYGSSPSRGVWQMSTSDFDGFNHENNNVLAARHTGDDWYANTWPYFKLYGVNNITYNVNSTGPGRSWTTSYEDWEWKFWFIKKRWYTVYVSHHEDEFWFNFDGDKYKGYYNGNKTRNIDSNRWNGGFGMISSASSGNATNTEIRNIRLNLKEYGYSIQSGGKYTKKTYKLSDDIKNKDVFNVVKEDDITPSLRLLSVNSNVGNSTGSANANTKVFRSDALTFILDNYNPNLLSFDGIQASADGKSWVDITGANGYSVILDAKFFADVRLTKNTGTIYFRPKISYKNADVVFEIDDRDKNKGEYVGVSTNLKMSSKVQLHIGDKITNIKGKAAVAAYQPGFSYGIATSGTNNVKNYVSAADGRDLVLDKSNSQGGVAEYTANTDNLVYIRLSYSNPSVKVMADPNTYRNTFTNLVITVDGNEYKTDNQDDVDKLHALMENIYKEDKDANVKITFDYQFNPEYMNGAVTYDSDFGDPQSATLTVYDGDTPKRETVRAEVTESDGKDIYSFTFEGNWKEKGWKDGSTASIIINGENGFTSLETEIDFLSTSGSYVIAYDDAKNIMKDINGNKVGTLKRALDYRSLNPLISYTFNATPSEYFVARWGDYSLDTNNDGNISNSDEDNEIARAEKRLEELEQDKSLASKNAEVYFGNGFAYQPSIFAQSKLYYDFVKRDTSVGTGNRVGLKLVEVKGSALHPKNLKETPLKDAVVTIAGSAVATEGTKGNYYDIGAYEKGQNYLADVVYQGVHFQARCVGTRTIEQKINTSSVMFPSDFTVQENGKEILRANGNLDYVSMGQVGGKKHTFSFNFKSDIGVTPNKARIYFYDGDDKLIKEETLTRKSPAERFSYEADLVKLGIKPGSRMTIQGIYNDGEQEYSYPEVESGCIFARDLTALSIAASFKTPFAGALKMFGKIATNFDLPLDYDLGSLGTRPVQYEDSDGATHRVLQIAFGYNTDIKKKLEELQTKEMAANGGNAMSGRGVVDAYVRSIMDGGVIKTKSEKDKDKKEGKEEKTPAPDNNPSSAKDKADKAVDPKAAPQQSKMQSKSSFDFAFNVAVILTVETGPSTDSKKAGDNYFDSLMLVAGAEAKFASSIIYTTPIGIDIIVQINAGGKAVAAFAATASSEKRYDDVYDLTKNGADKSYKFKKDSVDMYTKFLVAPTLTLGAGAGIGGGKIASVIVSGAAAFDFRFNAPIIGTDTSSQGSGHVKLSADVELKILFIKKKWNLYKSKTIDLFSYGASSINDMFEDFGDNYLYDAINAGDLTEVSRDYLKNASDWQPYDVSAMKVEAGAENILKEGVYPYPDAKMLELGNGLLLAVFLDDPGKETKNDDNRSTVMYSLSEDDGANWSAPVSIDGDKTWDEAPEVFKVTDKKALVLWSDADKELKKVNESGDVEDNLTSLDISGAWFDVDTKTMSAPFTVASTKIDERTDFQETAPMAAYDPETGRLMVYFTTTDYLEDGAESSGNGASDNEVSDIEDSDEKEEAVTYGDIINGYSAIGIVSADINDDGTFGEFSEPQFANLGIPATVTDDGINYNAKTDPKIIDSDIISYNGLALYAYTVDYDQNDRTVDDRELFVQIYNYGENSFHHPIQITADTGNDCSPKFVRCKNMTYLYWLNGGDIKYVNITELVRNLDSGIGSLKLKEVESVSKDEEGKEIKNKVDMYFIDRTVSDPVMTAVEHKKEVDEDGEVTEDLIGEFDIQSNGEVMYLLWTDLVTDVKDENATGADNVIKMKHIFGAYCEPEKKLVEKEKTETFENTEYIRYNFADGEGKDTYPVSATALKDNIGPDGSINLAEGDVYTFDYSEADEDINGQVGKVKAGDPVVRTIQSIVSTDGLGWSKPIQITRNVGEDYNYDDVSFRVTGDDEIQAIFSRGKEEYDSKTGGFSANENTRLLAVQKFAVTNTLETTDLVYGREKGTSAEDEEVQGEENPENTSSSDDKTDGNARYCYAGDTVDYSVDVTNDGFKPIDGVTYRTYTTLNGDIVEGSDSEWTPIASETRFDSTIHLDEEELPKDPTPYTPQTELLKGEDIVSNAETVNSFIGGETVTIKGRTVLGDEIEGTKFVVEIRNGEDVKKLEQELLVEANISMNTISTELINDKSARVKVLINNSGNKEYKGDVVLKCGDTVLETMKDVQLMPLDTTQCEFITDISGCKFGDVTTNEDGSKQDVLALTAVYGDYNCEADIIRQTSPEAGKAYDAIKQIDIVASDATDEKAEGEKVGATLNIPANKPVTLETRVTTDSNSITAKELEKLGYTADAHMITEWQSSDPSVAYVSSKGLIVPMKKGSTEITALIYPGQLEQTGVADAGTGTTSDELKDFGTMTSPAGKGSYAENNGRYSVPEKLITRKTFKLDIGDPVVIPTEEPKATNSPDTTDVPKATDVPKTDNPTVTGTPEGTATQAPGTDAQASPTSKAPQSPVTAGKIKYNINKGKNTVTVSKAVNKNAGKLTIPAAVKIEGKSYKVTAIANGAFKNMKKLTRVTIGRNVTSIGNKAFYGCSKLKTILFKSKKPPKIGKQAFKGIAKKAVFAVPSDSKKKYKKKLTKATGFAKGHKIKQK